MAGSRLMLFLFVSFGVIVFGRTTYSAVITIPQSSLVPSTTYYTDMIGGGIGVPAIMTGGGNVPNIGGSRNDDGYSGSIPLGFSLPYFGHTYSSFYANNNGNISFNEGLPQFTPTGPQGASEPVISPFFSDVDTRNPQSGLMYIRRNIPNEVVVTWNHVGYYGFHADKLNSYQLVLLGPDYPIPPGEGRIGFFYKNMQWETGDASGGSGGFGGTPAAVGFGDGQSNGEVLQGSTQTGISRVVSNHHIWFDQHLNSQHVTVLPNATHYSYSAALASTAATETHPIGRLEIFSPTGTGPNAFDPTTPQALRASGFDPAEPTYVLIHGWAGPGIIYDNEEQPLSPNFVTLGRDIKHRLNANVLAWNWEYESQTNLLPPRAGGPRTSLSTPMTSRAHSWLPNTSSASDWILLQEYAVGDR